MNNQVKSRIKRKDRADTRSVCSSIFREFFQQNKNFIRKDKKEKVHAVLALQKNILHTYVHIHAYVFYVNTDSGKQALDTPGNKNKIKEGTSSFFLNTHTFMLPYTVFIFTFFTIQYFLTHFFINA